MFSAEALCCSLFRYVLTTELAIAAESVLLRVVALTMISTDSEGVRAEMTWSARYLPAAAASYSLVLLFRNFLAHDVSLRIAGSFAASVSSLSLVMICCCVAISFCMSSAPPSLPVVRPPASSFSV